MLEDQRRIQEGGEAVLHSGGFGRIWRSGVATMQVPTMVGRAGACEAEEQARGGGKLLPAGLELFCSDHMFFNKFTMQ